VGTQRSVTRAKRFRAIVARTKAACWICGTAIDYELTHTDPMSFVIDHVVPLHRGGLDDMSNIKAAHRTCNSTKRARLVAPIIRRSGSLQAP